MVLPRVHAVNLSTKENAQTTFDTVTRVLVSVLWLLRIYYGTPSGKLSNAVLM